MDLVLTILSGVFITLGIISVLIGSLGLIRLPDVFSRIHAAGMIDTAGVAFFILGMICISGWSLVTVKLVLIGVFLFFTSPISGHAIARVAYLCGEKPTGLEKAKAPKRKAPKSKSKTGTAKS